MTNTGRPPQAEELAALHEQLAESRAEVERLQSDTADAEARAATAAAETAEVRNELLSIQQFRTTAEAEAQSARTYLEAAEARLRSAAEKYRDLVVRTEPEIPQELIAGNDIDEVDASVTAAKEIVDRVRTHIETQTHAQRIPAGAPPRAAPDYSALSPEQKIRLGLTQRAS